MKLKKISDYEWEIPCEGEMKVPGRIFASEKLLEKIKEDKSLEQVKNVAKLPGILRASYAMADMHQGYGMSIGGVAAFDLETGGISPGMCGFDINCGVRVLATNISVEDFVKKRKEVLHDFSRTIPSGVGRGHKQKLSEGELDEILRKGAEWAVEKGYGVKEDLERCEEGGCMKSANPSNVSPRARARGKPQSGSLGAGNHFIEVQKIGEIYDLKVAKAFGLEEDKIVIMIHCGSRGLGHQVASDYMKAIEKEYGYPSWDRELANAPINSELGKKYYGAMSAAVNFAFCNRQLIMHYVRKVLERHFPSGKSHLVYDVCHNISKFEEHKIDGKKRKVLVTRKGATRAFGKGRKEIPKVYRKIGQPVIIPGSMGTSSYILVGTGVSEGLAWGSTAHGAGRVMSRSKAVSLLKGEDVKKKLGEMDIEIEAGSMHGIASEAPEAYKDIDEVIRVSDSLGLAKKIVKLKPLAVMKG